MRPLLFIFIAYLLAGSLIPNSDFTQLRRFSELSAHFQDHKSEALHKAESVSFWEFAFLHFVSPGDHHDADHAGQHKKLPLQNFDFSFSFLGFFSTSSNSHPIFSKKNLQSLEPRYMLQKGFPTSVFHPPTSS